MGVNAIAVAIGELCHHHSRLHWTLLLVEGLRGRGYLQVYVLKRNKNKQNQSIFIVFFSNNINFVFVMFHKSYGHVLHAKRAHVEDIILSNCSTFEILEQRGCMGIDIIVILKLQTPRLSMVAC